MALITAIADIIDANGKSVVPADPDGTKPVKVLQLSGDFSYTYTRSGDVGIVALSVASGAGGNTSKAYVDQQAMIAKLAYVQQQALTSQWIAVIAENRTGVDVTIPGVRLIPYDDFAQDAVNYVSVSLKTADLDLNVPSRAILCTVNTQTGDPNGLNQTFAAGTPLNLKAIGGSTGPFTVPTGKIVFVEVDRVGATCPAFSVIAHA